jgi:hypothetical protein
VYKLCHLRGGCIVDIHGLLLTKTDYWHPQDASAILAFHTSSDLSHLSDLSVAGRK